MAFSHFCREDKEIWRRLCLRGLHFKILLSRICGDSSHCGGAVWLL